MVHIYDWLSYPEMLTTKAELKVWEFLSWKTLPASESSELTPKYLGLKVYCKCAGIEYRITGASRFGDIWLKDNSPELEIDLDPNGYDKRVFIDSCYEFSYIDERETNNDL